ncbi:DUF397 domain-containing protein [Streptosporangium longisporum]|uniref:DUF397 domain-containing protein n=1 Tax=Streptosporangium longisporum TaxID=46187 RepID=UPI0031F1AB38
MHISARLHRVDQRGGESVDLSKELENAVWRKATKSGPNGGDCLEVAPLSGGKGRPARHRGPGEGFLRGERRRLGRVRRRSQEGRIRLPRCPKDTRTLSHLLLLAVVATLRLEGVRWTSRSGRTGDRRSHEP